MTQSKDEPALGSYLNGSLEECKANGNHLQWVDDDGYCNACGEQDDSEKQ